MSRRRKTNAFPAKGVELHPWATKGGNNDHQAGLSQAVG